MLRHWKIVSLFVAVTSFASCAGSGVSGVEPLPKDLPVELQKKFEVMEAPQPSPTVSPAPEPLKPMKGKKKSKAAAKKEKSGAPAAPFVYPNRHPSNPPFWVGEKHTLEITYIGLAAGEFTMEVLPVKAINNRRAYHLKGHAVSSKVFNLFYRLNDTIDSFWDFEGLFSHRFHMVLDQTKQSRDALELYDSEKKQGFYWNRKNHVTKGYTETKDYVEISPFPQDSFSAIYYLRTLPLEEGKQYTFPVVSEGRAWEAVVTVVRREMMDTPLGKKMCIVVRPQTRYQGVMRQERGESYIWLTDDDRRLVVRLEAKVKVGSVAARLKEVELGEKPNAE
jgi:hypothetical protein